MNSTNFFEEEKTSKPRNALIEILQVLIVAISLSVFIYVFVVTPNEVDGDSMVPNLHNSDLLFTSKLHEWFSGTDFGKSVGLTYNRGDIVVFQNGPDDYVKRVIALPGEKVRIEDGIFYINGQRYIEDFEIMKDLKRDDTFLIDGGPEKTVPENHYMLVGDNREISYDSRSLGFVDRSRIRGKVIFRFWPLSDGNFGIVQSGNFSVTGAIDND